MSSKKYKVRQKGKEKVPNLKHTSHGEGGSHLDEGQIRTCEFWERLQLYAIGTILGSTMVKLGEQHLVEGHGTQGGRDWMVVQIHCVLYDLPLLNRKTFNCFQDIIRYHKSKTLKRPAQPLHT